MAHAGDGLLQFYLPHRGSLDALPGTIDEYWPWIAANRSIGEGRYSWTLQTYLQLAAAGWPCRLVSRFPAEGIVVSHRDFLPLFLRPRSRVFLVCIKPDRKPHPWAQFHIVQNASDRTVSHARGRSAVVTFWPQPGLRPRGAERGTRCVTAAYIGRAVNLAPELRQPEWAAEAATLGFDWRTPPLERWHDYHDIDVVVSVRAFGSEQPIDNPVLDPDSKPPSKLINSWLAGVPAILGGESSFRHIRVDPLDYIEATSVAELTAALRRLQADGDLYQRMVDHGRRRAREYAADAVVARWLRIVQGQILPGYRRWRARGAADRHRRNIAEMVRFFADARNRPSPWVLLRR